MAAGGITRARENLGRSVPALLQPASTGLLIAAGLWPLRLLAAGACERAACTELVPRAAHIAAEPNVSRPAGGRAGRAIRPTYPGSHPLGASWHGLVACGPGPTQGGSDHLVSFFPGAWGELEWECVELSMRWMYLAWGVNPYPADGWDVVRNYGAHQSAVQPDGPQLDVVSNGTRRGRTPARRCHLGCSAPSKTASVTRPS